jgi:hypothetical protein
MAKINKIKQTTKRRKNTFFYHSQKQKIKEQFVASARKGNKTHIYREIRTLVNVLTIMQIKR